MFSWTRFRTASCPFTSVNRVSMSSGMYVWTPPFDMNQKIATNCITPMRDDEDDLQDPGEGVHDERRRSQHAFDDAHGPLFGPKTYVWEM
jgi:hypothetical protein